MNILEAIAQAILDNLKANFGPVFSGYSIANGQSIPAGGALFVSFSSPDEQDGLEMFDDQDPDQLTVPEGVGAIEITAQVPFPGEPGVHHSVDVRLNGTVIANQTVACGTNQGGPANASINVSTGPIEVTEGDNVAVRVFNGSMQAKNVTNPGGWIKVRKLA